MTRIRMIYVCILFGAVACPAMAASRHYAISADLITATIEKMGVQIAPSQVGMFSEVVATTPAPSLQVRSVERVSGARFMFRLECVNGDDCLPFMASVQMSEAGANQLADIAERMSLGKSSYSNSTGQAQPRQILIRNGSPATLQLDSDHVHIRIPVICLQSGSAGQTIRATDKDHRRFYSAQVIDSGVLRGKL